MPGTVSSAGAPMPRCRLTAPQGTGRMSGCGLPPTVLGTRTATRGRIGSRSLATQRPMQGRRNRQSEPGVG
jgi:hypothetical protein